MELAKAQAAQAERHWERVKDGASPADLAVLEASLADAQRELERWRNGPNPDEVAAARAHVEAAQAALSLPVLAAPFTGKITDVSVKVGDKVAPGSLAFRLDDTARLLVDVLVSEVDVNRIHEGQAAELTLDGASGRTYHGVVTKTPVVGVDLQGVTSFPVTVEISDGDDALRPGMTGSRHPWWWMRSRTPCCFPTRRCASKTGSAWCTCSGMGDSYGAGEAGCDQQGHLQVLEGDVQPGDMVLLNPSEALSGSGGISAAHARAHDALTGETRTFPPVSLAGRSCKAYNGGSSWRKSMKKWVIIVIVIAVLAGALFLFWRWRSSRNAAAQGALQQSPYNEAT